MIRDLPKVTEQGSGKRGPEPKLSPTVVQTEEGLCGCVSQWLTAKPETVERFHKQLGTEESSPELGSRSCLFAFPQRGAFQCYC